jgi:hypothetical protein
MAALDAAEQASLEAWLHATTPMAGKGKQPERFCPAAERSTDLSLYRGRIVLQKRHRESPHKEAARVDACESVQLDQEAPPI